MKYLILLLI